MLLQRCISHSILDIRSQWCRKCHKRTEVNFNTLISYITAKIFCYDCNLPTCFLVVCKAGAPSICIVTGRTPLFCKELRTEEHSCVQRAYHNNTCFWRKQCPLSKAIIHSSHTSFYLLANPPSVDYCYFSQTIILTASFVIYVMPVQTHTASSLWFPRA